MSPRKKGANAQTTETPATEPDADETATPEQLPRAARGETVAETVERTQQAEAKRLKALADARKAQGGRGRPGLTRDEQRRLVFLLREGKDWREAVRAGISGYVDPEVLERWRPELERLAQEGDQRVMPNETSVRT